MSRQPGRCNGAKTTRRHLLAGSAALAMIGRPHNTLADNPLRFRDLWRVYRDRFVLPDGRVVDSGNGNVSHSESQGYGLIFAASAEDRPTFDRILRFAIAQLRVRGDALFAWRFDPRSRPAVRDQNNATDGDMAIAWGCLLGAIAWNDIALAAEAQRILLDVLRKTLRTLEGGLVLLPGAFGFERNTAVLLNPSYAMFPAWQAFRRLMPGQPWERLEQDVLTLLGKTLFGRRRLPPDWVRVSRTGQRFELPSEWPARFSYDAVRVPLYMVWGGHVQHPAVQSADRTWRRSAPARTPAWIDLITDAEAPYRASPGLLAVRAVATRDADLLRRIAAVADDDYYSASLRLLSWLAAERNRLLTRNATG